jgi:A/G-specific adenine glycosylase
VDALLKWFAASARNLPWRQTLDPYAIWVSEIMLQQTQVKTVIPYWNRWMKEFPDVVTLARGAEAEVLKLWEGLGYYSRARNLQKAARLIVDDHGGRFPESVEGLLGLPGIGPYTAGAIASIAFNQPEPILDGNIIRVLTRVYALPGDPKERRLNGRLWDLARTWVTAASTLPLQPIPHLVTSGNCSALNQALMELGATHCTPKSPNCDGCPIRSDCRAARDGTVESFPETAARPTTVHLRRVAVILRHGETFLVRKRPVGAVNAGFWEFPECDIPAPAENAIGAASTWTGIAPESFETLGVLIHSITRYRIRLEGVQATVKPKRVPRSLRLENPAGESDWLPLRQLADLPFTAAHRRLVRRLESGG